MKAGRWLPLAIFLLLAALLTAGVWMSRDPDRNALPSAPTTALPHDGPIHQGTIHEGTVHEGTVHDPTDGRPNAA